MSSATKTTAKHPTVPSNCACNALQSCGRPKLLGAWIKTVNENVDKTGKPSEKQVQARLL
ncbi:MAG: hypothetical protein LBO64_08675 [Desulfovibrio sp.]|nr:hypothetical protein [Desulfovibrio sp.]